MHAKLFLSVGEIRTQLFKIFEPNQIDLLVAAPGHLGDFSGMNKIHHQPTQPLRREETYAFRKALLERLAIDVDTLPQTEKWRDIIMLWCEGLASGNVRCFHFTRTPLFTRLISKAESTMLTPAPINTNTLKSELELNVQLTGKEHQRARSWFTEKAQQSEDISQLLRESLLTSWAGDIVSPKDLYHKILSEYFEATINGLDNSADNNPLLEQLTEFQVEAYEYSKGILLRYGGVFLADVVGLGKTFIALALLKHLQDHYNEHALVIAPPNVIPAWKDLAAEFRVELQMLSIGKLDDLHLYRDREILVIDESHNFRNKGTQRYAKIEKYLRPNSSASSRKILLLSATPQNNHADDVKHQLAFFPDNYTRLPYQGDSIDSFFRQVQHGQVSMSKLLQHVVVRRTRRFIQKSYPNATLRVRKNDGQFQLVPLLFPERHSGEDQCLRYSINETYEDGDLYALILNTLAELYYAPYSLSKYLTELGKKDPRLDGLRRAGSSIRGLFKVLLLKRLESSIVAFKNTLQRFRERVQSYLDQLEEGLVTVSLKKYSPDDIADDDVRETWKEERQVPKILFRYDDLRTDLESDLVSILALESKVDTINLSNDAKVQRLKRYFLQRPPTEHKTIVFTQFSDTAEHLQELLGQEFGRTQIVTGKRGNAISTARKFSPISNRVEISKEDRIDLLISTDALSEGVNLQDADTLINYDIHWNPVRLIQRAGRIDRIGSKHEIINIASFLPELGLESALGIEAVLRSRIKDFLAVFGEDSHVLPSDEKLDSAMMLSAYTGEALNGENEDDEMDGLSRHVERLLKLRRESPKELERILKIRVGKHSISDTDKPPIAASRLGWFWHFWVFKNDQTKFVDDLRGLDIFFAHSKGSLSSAQRIDRKILGEFIVQIRNEFGPIAEAFREQRLHPKLTASEEFVLERLEEYKRICIATRENLVNELINWVRAGSGQVQLKRQAVIWKKKSFPIETVFNETRRLFASFSVRQEEFGEPEVIGAILGKQLEIQ